MGGRVEKRGSGKGTEDIYIMKYQRLRRSSLFGQSLRSEMPRSSVQKEESLRPFSHRGSKATADRKGQTPEIAERQKEPQYSHQRGTRQPLVPTWWQRGCPYVVRTTTRPQLQHKKGKKVWRLAGLIFLRWTKPHEWWAEFGK